MPCLTAGDQIRFACGRDDALTRVTRVTRYTSFEEMLDAEGPVRVNPTSPGDLQTPGRLISVQWATWGGGQVRGFRGLDTGRA